MDCSPPGCSVHGIFQARILQWVAIPFSRGSYWPRDWTQVSCIAGWFFTIWATREDYQITARILMQESLVSWGQSSRWIGFVVVVLFSHSVMSDSLRPHGLKHARLPCPSPYPGACSNPCPLNQWCHPTISSSVVPVSTTLNLSQHQGLFKSVSSLHQVAKVLELQLQHQSF